MDQLIPNLSKFVPKLQRTIMLPGCGYWTQQERARGQRRDARVLEGAVRWRGPGAADAGECFLALTFGTNYGRLRALKAVYDPTSLVRVNADVAP